MRIQLLQFVEFNMPHKDLEKQKEYKHKWYMENRERILKERAIIYQAKTKEERHPEERKEYFRKRYVENKEEIDKKTSEWAKNHPEKKALYARRSYHKNPEKMKASHRKWMKANPEKNRLYHFRRRANGYDKIDIDILDKVFENNIKEYGVLTCIYCEIPIGDKKKVIDHLTPISRGGDNSYENLGVACFSCNSSKKDKTYDEFIKYKSVADLSNKYNVSLKQCTN